VYPGYLGQYFIAQLQGITIQAMLLEWLAANGACNLDLSSKLYPLTSIISIRSRSAGFMVATVLAVVINSTFENHIPLHKVIVECAILLGSAPSSKPSGFAMEIFAHLINLIEDDDRFDDFTFFRL
jgi:hypothetical protein